jgi:outer membrane protein OmpA-like peptidoglycan-associated protein
MIKSIICLAGCILLTVNLLQARDNRDARQVQGADIQIGDTTAREKDSAARSSDSVSNRADTSAKPQDSVVKTQDTATGPQQAASRQANGGSPDNSAKPAADDAKQQADTARHTEHPYRRELDTRWFISPLLKVQFQDFGMLEKDRKGYLSDANTLPFASRGNGSFAASAYKNITGRLSISADLGLSFGHSTNDSMLISQTKSKTYNLLNATVFYHLLNPSFALQPFISIGFNDIISDASYLTAPIGVGAKFNGRKIMVMGQVAYGYALSKNIANTTMYSLGIYLPIKNKKSKQMEKEDNSPYNRSANNKNDSSGKRVVNNFYITIKMDSVLNARNRKNGDGMDDDDALGNLVKAGRNKKGNGSGGNGSSGNGSGGNGTGDGDGTGDKKGFELEESRVDTVNGRPVFKFFVYFEFNEYALNSKAFSAVDHAIAQMRKNPEQNILINGFADDIGTIPQNNFISRKRSQMVFEYMNSRGVASERMTPKFFGKQFPVASNDDPNMSWLNRRVEIVVEDKDYKVASDKP